MNTRTRFLRLTYTLALDPPLPWEESGRHKRRVALDRIVLEVYGGDEDDGKISGHWNVGGKRLRQDGTESEMAPYREGLYWYNDGVSRIPVEHRSSLRAAANADLASLGLPALGPTSKEDEA